MFERYCLLRSGAAFIMSISTLSVVAQDTPVGPGPKAPVTVVKPAEDETTELSKATQNPVARLISVPYRTTATLELVLIIL